MSLLVLQALKGYFADTVNGGECLLKSATRTALYLGVFQHILIIINKNDAKVNLPLPRIAALSLIIPGAVLHVPNVLPLLPYTSLPP